MTVGIFLTVCLDVSEKICNFVVDKQKWIMADRKYPIGIQTFSEIIRGGYVYVDKTDLAWKLIQQSKYTFLSRPRRFGKSLLTSTLKAYFEGCRDLFEGLKIMPLEQEWKTYPVIHIDLSQAKSQPSAEALQQRIMFMLKDYTNIYGQDADETTPGALLTGLVKRAHRQTGHPVVVLIDEYDAPLLEVLHEEQNLPEFRRVMQEFYVPLKALDPYLRYCFITGITKFSQLSIFSTINNLNNVTMLPQFSAICGITEEELNIVMEEDIRLLAESQDYTPEEMRQRLKNHYDGYHFSEYSPEMYNPFSLMKCFQNKKLQNYWFESGTPTYLLRQMQHFHTDITTLDYMEETADSFDVPTEAMHSALPLLYQSGYLTIKNYDPEAQTYLLSLPNQEVRIGYTKGLLPTYAGLDVSNTQTGFALKFWRALKKHDPNLAMREMQAFLAGIPYVEGFKKKLEEAATKEGFYEYTLYLIFSMLNVYVRTQVKCSGGRVDMVVWMPDNIYVFEFKVNGTAEDALRQIDDQGYAIPYQTDHRPVVKIGVKFNADTRIPESWQMG